MLPPIYAAFSFSYVQNLVRLGISFVILAVLAVSAQAWRPTEPPANALGVPVVDQNGKPIIYDKKSMAKMAAAAAVEPATTTRAVSQASASAASLISSFVPAGAAQAPFWQYSIFGSGIGVSNIILSPVSNGGNEIIIGGNSGSNFGADDFWHVLRWNPGTGQYEQIFVSPIYSSPLKRIALGDVIGDGNQEIVVMLADGRIYLYDLATKTELGYIKTGISSLEGLCLINIQDDGHVEVIVTTINDLFVFNGAGSLLWSVPGVGGYDVIAGQMDNDPAREIATTAGKVVDAFTHNVQWTRTSGFGRSLRLAPFPGENYEQLIVAEGWYYVYSYDIARQLPRWSIHTDLDIGALQVANVDGDATPEILIGDGQWGEVHVYDLVTQAHKWQVANPEHGVTNIAVADVDGDGIPDLLWGAGWTSTGADYLYVADASAHRIKWQSFDLVGPLLGPLIGDLDGDGQPELVTCSYESKAGYDSGRILVFDLATLTLRGISAPVVDNRCWTGVHDLKLRDLDGDGRMEIIVAGDNLYDGVIEVYGFNSSNAFIRDWTNTTRPSGSPFNYVEVADLDGNGTPEIIGGNTVAHTGSEGVYVYIFDYPSGANPWRSVNLASGFSSITGMFVRDLDHNGSKEIVALVGSGDLYTFDGPSRNLRSLVQATDFKRLSVLANDFGLIGLDGSGTAHFLQYRGERYLDIFTRTVGPLGGINELPDDLLWTGSGGILSLVAAPYKTVAWQSPFVGDGVGRFVALDVRNGQDSVFTSTRHAVIGMTYTAPAPASDLISLTPDQNDALLTISGISGKTFRLERKLNLTDPNWQVISQLRLRRNGLAQFVDPNVMTLGKAFYQIHSSP